jgi:hypothetical protein
VFEQFAQDARDPRALRPGFTISVVRLRVGARSVGGGEAVFFVVMRIVFGEFARPKPPMPIARLVWIKGLGGTVRNSVYGLSG